VAAALLPALAVLLAAAEALALLEPLELQAARPAARARPAVATEVVTVTVRQLWVLAACRGFSCIVVPSTSLSTV
jgi:hypothetical protein